MKSITIILNVVLLIAFSAANAQINFESQLVSNNTLMASSFINDNEGWLADNAGKLSHTSNAGQSWENISVGINFLKVEFVNSLDGFGLCSSAAYKTNDGGHTWSALSLPGSIGKAIYFFDSNNGFICGNKQVYKTTNGGTTWSVASTDDVSFVDMYFVNSSTGIAAANDDESSKSIWRTTDGGLSWINVYNRPKYFVNAVWFTNENSGYAVGYYNQIDAGHNPEILKTTDGGITWNAIYRNQEIIRPGEGLIDIRFKNSLEGVAISNYSESVYTTDGGETWNRFYEDENSGLPESQPLYKTIGGGQSELYISGENGNLIVWK